MSRILIIGPPRSGKSTLAANLGPNRSTDSVLHLGWSEASAEVATWFNEPYTIIEGVAIPRALRKWHLMHPGEPPPVDKIIYLRTPFEPLTNGQQAMAKGITTVMAEIQDWLKDVPSERHG